MEKSPSPATLSKILLSLALGATAQMSSANEMPFRVGQDVNGWNTAFVSVTLCEPRTSRCKTIDRIKLDTGSDGLRVLKSALGGLNLPRVQSMGLDVALCAEMAGGTGYWGPIAKADVKLGDASAPEANIQIVDASYFVGKTPCKSVPSDGRNGILGMGTVRSVSYGKTFYFCSSGLCSVSFVDESKRPLNPLSYMKKDNNGFVVSTPDVPARGQNSIDGVVRFGIGTKTNNTPRGGVDTCHVQSDDYLKVESAGKEFLTKADTGSFAYNVPKSAAHFPACMGGIDLACPASNRSVPLKIFNADGSVCSTFEIHPNDPELAAGFVADSWVKPNLVSSFGGAMEGNLVLGMPFFYGRDVYFGFTGKKSSLGRGPLIAF